jgi:hypothetical protein
MLNGHNWWRVGVAEGYLSLPLAYSSALTKIAAFPTMCGYRRLFAHLPAAKFAPQDVLRGSNPDQDAASRQIAGGK